MARSISTRLQRIILVLLAFIVIQGFGLLMAFIFTCRPVACKFRFRDHSSFTLSFGHQRPPVQDSTLDRLQPLTDSRLLGSGRRQSNG